MTSRKYFLTNLLFILSLTLKAQIGQQLNTSGRFSALGNASVAINKSPEALWSNPANVRGIKGKAAILSSEWRYSVKDFRPIALGFIMPSTSSTFGFAIQHFAFSSVSDNILGVTYARPFSEKIDVGVHLKYQHVRVRGIGSKNILGFDLGFNLLIFKDLRMGFHAQNPIPFKIGDGNITPSVFRLGLHYFINENVALCSEIIKNSINPISFRLGLEYKPYTQVYLRGGFETQPTTFAFGIGYVFSEKIKIDMSLSNHSILGTTPAISIIFMEKNK